MVLANKIARLFDQVEDKFGIYEKSWEWYGDTPLIAASR